MARTWPERRRNKRERTSPGEALQCATDGCWKAGPVGPARKEPHLRMVSAAEAFTKSRAQALGSNGQMTVQVRPLHLVISGRDRFLIANERKSLRPAR